MVRLAVVGKDVSKSLSPEMHRFILESLGEKCSYEKVSLPREEFSANAEELFLRYDGFNVTIPFKEEVLPFLNELARDFRRCSPTRGFLFQASARLFSASEARERAVFMRCVGRELRYTPTQKTKNGSNGRSENTATLRL